jgi:hypothetical protein
VVFRHTFGPTTGLKFCAKSVREWLRRLGVGTLFIEPGSPWGNGLLTGIDRGIINSRSIW